MLPDRLGRQLTRHKNNLQTISLHYFHTINFDLFDRVWSGAPFILVAFARGEAHMFFLTATNWWTSYTRDRPDPAQEVEKELNNHAHAME